ATALTAPKRTADVRAIATPSQLLVPSTGFHGRTPSSSTARACRHPSSTLPPPSASEITTSFLLFPSATGKKPPTVAVVMGRTRRGARMDRHRQDGARLDEPAAASHAMAASDRDILDLVQPQWPPLRHV